MENEHPIPLGDRIKEYEGKSDLYLNDRNPIVIRIDGRGFSKLTGKLDRPDYRFNRAMMEATRYLVSETRCDLGYTQSDEINLVFLPHEGASEMMFGGRVQKLTSVFASLASVAFGKAMRDNIPELADRLPVFDCRVFGVPNIGEAANSILWRVRDATKNASSMVAQTVFSANQLMGVSSKDRVAMLMEAGVDFYTYPTFFRNGSFWQRQNMQVLLAEESRLAIPENMRPAEGATVMRTQVIRTEMPEFITYGAVEALLT